MDFIEYGWAFVPEKAHQRSITLLLVPVNLPLRVTELCCGDGEFAEALLEARPKVSVCAFDGDRRMLDCARERLSVYNERVQLEYFDLFATNMAPLRELSDIIVSSLAVHHLSDDDKKRLFRDIWNGLEAGGEFILSDIFKPSTGLGGTSPDGRGTI